MSYPGYCPPPCYPTGPRGCPGATGAQGAQGRMGLRGPTGAEGSQGFTGAQGAQGFTGAQGAQGFTGVQGPTGAQGFTGYTGAQGFTGDTGAQGFTGETGAQGFTGSQGFTGDTGAQGFTGETGAQGFTGYTGAQGFTGDTGAQGFTGETGAQGFTGYTGAQGFTGAQGEQGIPGVDSDTGATGAQGFTGETGAQGFTGDTGAQGFTGETGAQGFTGAQGDQGVPGIDSDTGATGATGAQGFTGAQGVAGSSFGTGATGAQGFTGAQGAAGLGGIVTNYGQFYTNLTESTFSGLVTSIWNFARISNGITIVSGTQVTVSTSGVYYFEHRLQARDTSSVLDNSITTNFYVNGSLVANSSTFSFLIDTVYTATCELSLAAGQYVEVKVLTSDIMVYVNPTNDTPALQLNVFQLAYNGPTGATGAQGFTGATGAQGATGACCTGPTGAQGAAGVAGSASNIVASYYYDGSGVDILSISPVTLPFPTQLVSTGGIVANGTFTTFTIPKTGYYEIAYNTTISFPDTYDGLSSTPSTAISKILKNSVEITGSSYLTVVDPVGVGEQPNDITVYKYLPSYHANSPFIALLTIGDIISVTLEVTPYPLLLIVPNYSANFISIKQVASDIGATGATGVQGATGAQGFTGATGATGAQGFTGAQGAAGLGGIVSNYGQFYSDGLYGILGSPITIQWTNTSISSGIIATGTNNIKIQVSTPGTYYFENRVQALTGADESNPDHSTLTHFYKNNDITPLPNSSTYENSPGSNLYTEVLIASTIVTLLANETIRIELVWSGVSSPFPFYNEPNAPACLLKVFQLAYNGPTGATGPAGPTGATGATGPAGPTGTVIAASEYYKISSDPTGSIPLTNTTIPPIVISTGSFIVPSSGPSWASLNVQVSFIFYCLGDIPSGSLSDVFLNFALYMEATRVTPSVTVVSQTFRQDQAYKTPPELVPTGSSVTAIVTGSFMDVIITTFTPGETWNVKLYCSGSVQTTSGWIISTIDPRRVTFTLVPSVAAP